MSVFTVAGCRFSGIVKKKMEKKILEIYSTD